MDDNRTVHCIVLGGGAAGLCLGYYLAKKQTSASELVILEKRESYKDDRAWCFWENPDNTTWLSDLVSKNWWQWEISGQGQVVTHQATNRPYCYLRSGDFYDTAVKQIHSSPHVSLKTGVDVYGVEEKNNRCFVKTSKGTFQSKYIIDTREPTKRELAGSKLLQAFVGYEVRFDQNILDPKRASVMRNIVANDGELSFEYMLPFDSAHALIEQTVFTYDSIDFDYLEKRLQQTIDRLQGRRMTEIIRCEKGVIPMGLRLVKRPRKSRLYRGGVRGGAARPSSGYALNRIDQWAKVCSDRLYSGKTPCDAYVGSMVERSLDSIFLRVLNDHLRDGPQIFTQMAKGTTGDQFAAFLSGSNAPSVLCSVISKMPKKLFLEAVAQELVG